MYDELRRLEQAATPGPWNRDKTSVRHVYHGFGSLKLAGSVGKDDAELICAMRNALPGLLDENERLRAQLLKGVIDSDILKLYDGSALDKADQYIKKLEDENERLRKERDEACDYKIYVPSENGYDVEGRFYECTCGADYIDIEQANEWIHCPFCGKEIASKETLSCAECQSCEWDGEDNICGNKKGKYYGNIVDDVCFDGCKEWHGVDGGAK